MAEKNRGELTVLLLIAIALGTVDALLPRPVPFLKLGLANAVSVVALYRLGFLRTLELNMMRAVAIALFTGTLATPSFILSISGAAASATVMALLRRLFSRSVSPVGVSAAGGAASMWVQLLAASVILGGLNTRGLVPLLSAWGVLSGAVTGLAAAFVLSGEALGGVLRRLDS